MGKKAKKKLTDVEKVAHDRKRSRYFEKVREYVKKNRKNPKRKQYAMFCYDSNGHILGFCNDSFSMSNRYGCVHLWDSPPLHYFDPKYYFIICITREYPDVRMTPLSVKNRDRNHAFKGNYFFEQINAATGEWVSFKDGGPVKKMTTIKEGRKLRSTWTKAKGNT